MKVGVNMCSVGMGKCIKCTMILDSIITNNGLLF